jgi:hypothetical protein
MLNLMTNKYQAIAKNVIALAFHPRLGFLAEDSGIVTETSNDLNSKYKKRCGGTAVSSFTNWFHNLAPQETLIYNMCINTSSVTIIRR